MQGSADLPWPTELGSRVAAQIGLCRRFADDRGAVVEYMYRVMGTQGNVNMRTRELLSRVIDPLLRDLGKLAARRAAPPALDAMLRAIAPATGDIRLDEMIADARTTFYDQSPVRRREGLERLWDAFERIKTVLDPADKKRSAGLLLDLVASEPNVRAVLEAEARALTTVGNEMQIRHHEQGKVPINSSEHVDYLFHRCFAFVWLAAGALARGKAP